MKKWWNGNEKRILNHKWKISILPSKTGLKLNCLKCGSSVAPRNPIDALVAIILIAHTIIPGIFNNDMIEAKLKFIEFITFAKLFFYVKLYRNFLPLDWPCCNVWLCLGRIHMVMIAVKNNNNPSVVNGRKNPPNWYKNPPTIGPTIKPRPKNVSNDANVTLTLSGNSLAIIANDAVKNAALPSASIIRTINANVIKTPCPYLK